MIASAISTHDAGPLGPADILGPSAYARVRRQYQRLMVELKRHRRCRLAPHVSILFENRETVLFQVHEVLHLEGHTPERIEEELSHYGCLVPGPGQLRATVMVDGGDREQGLRAIASLRRRGGVRLGCRELSCDSTLAHEDDDVEDAVQYLQLSPPPGMGSLLRDTTAPARLSVELDGLTLTTVVGPGLRAQIAQDLGVPAPSSIVQALACSSFTNPLQQRASWPF